jgi:hypothetical protein
MAYLSEGLSALADRLDPREAARVCGPAVAQLTQALGQTTLPESMRDLNEGLSALAVHLEPKEMDAAAAAAVGALARTTDAWAPPSLREDLTVLVSGVTFRTSRGRIAAVAATVGGLSGPWPLLAAPAVLRPALEPLSPPLSAQALVDLLKDPLCVGAARRAVLDQLARHYGRPFADQWDFVRFAEERRLGLDLLGPPPRLAAARARP